MSRVPSWAADPWQPPLTRLPVDDAECAGSRPGTIGRMVHHAVPPSLRGAVFVGATAVSEGLLSPDQLRGPAWRRVLHGVYVDAAVVIDHGVRCRAALLVAPADAAVAGPSAAWVLGARAARRAVDPVHLIVAQDATVPRRRGVVVHRFEVARSEMVVRGMRLTGPLRTAWDVATIEPFWDAVPVLDQLLHRRLVDRIGLRAYGEAMAGRWGARKASAAIAAADGRAESPPESRLRLELRRAGLEPEPQLVIRDTSGVFVARTDLGFRNERVAVEYDGSYHAESGQFARDRARLNRIDAAGWTVVFVTASDLRDMSAAVDRVRGALARARDRRRT